MRRRYTSKIMNSWTSFCCLKLRCDCRFQRAFTACSCVFKVINLVWANQGNYVENAPACSKRTLKTTVASQLYTPQTKTEKNKFWYFQNKLIFFRFWMSKFPQIKNKGWNSQNFLRKFIIFFVTLRCLYRVVIYWKSVFYVFYSS